MLSKKNSDTPPKAMTWGKATPVFIVALMFDLMRMFFLMFWFFGPTLAALYCTNKAGELVGSLGGLTGAACTGVAGVAGFGASAITVPFGTVMAMVVGFLGFLSLGLWILMTNARIFKTIASGGLWFGGSFLISEIPILGSIVPAFSIAIFKLYGTQIRIEHAALKKWERGQAEKQQREKDYQIAYLTQVRAAQIAQANQQAANDEAYESAQAANDERYAGEETNRDVRKAA